MFGMFFSYSDDKRWKDYVQETRQANRNAKKAAKAAEESARKMASAVEANTAAINAGFDRVVDQLDSLNDVLQETNALLEWGFQSIISELQLVNRSLAELVQIGRTPSHTAAMEHVVQAIENIKSELWQESLDRARKAIEEYPEEWRAYSALGYVYLQSTDARFLNPTHAVANFVSAAKYAKRRHPDIASRQFVGACRASAVQKTQPALEAALGYAHEAIQLDRNNGEAFFQAAKVLVCLGRLPHSHEPIDSAIAIDMAYAEKIEADADFSTHGLISSPYWIDKCQAALRNAQKRIAESAEVARHLQDWRNSLDNDPSTQPILRIIYQKTRWGDKSCSEVEGVCYRVSEYQSALQSTVHTAKASISTKRLYPLLKAAIDVHEVTEHYPNATVDMSKLSVLIEQTRLRVELDRSTRQQSSKILLNLLGGLAGAAFGIAIGTIVAFLDPIAGMLTFTILTPLCAVFGAATSSHLQNRQSSNLN